MIRLITPLQAKELDARSQKELNIPGATLMESAGRLTAETLKVRFPDRKTSIAVLCGPGNNAGDGVVMARHLIDMGYKKLKVYLLFSQGSWSDLLKIQVLKISAAHLVNMSREIDFSKCRHHDVFVDAIFGVGLSKPIAFPLEEFITQLNHQKNVISLDLPSGIDGATGEILGVAVKAELTVSYGPPKAGCFIRQGPAHSGKVLSLDIGFPPQLQKEIAKDHFLVSRRDVLKRLPQRKNVSNKTNHGHVKLWAGSPGMEGAAVLSARAAYRIGAGYVTHNGASEQLLQNVPEALTETKPTFDDKFVYAVGPGWGTTEENKNLLEQLHDKEISKVVVDADALTLMAKHKLPARSTWVLTPHTGELSRLLDGVPSADIERDRFRYALETSRKFGCTVLLKGYRSLLARGERVHVIPTGNAALAKAGSGDVLTGMIAGLWAQGLSGFSATLTATYIHGLLADEWLAQNDSSGLTPTDLLNEIPQLVKRLKTLP